jgi:hypothetical protein
MSNTAGQLGFLFPAIAIPVIIYLYNNKNQPQMWFIILSLIGFGIINEKRSIVYLIPIVIYASLLANHSLESEVRITKVSAKIILTLPLVLLSVLMGISFIPSLNVDSSYGGGVNIFYAFAYAIDYLIMDYGDSLQGTYNAAFYDKGIQVGRLTLLLSILEFISNAHWTIQLFGVGFGVATPSEWLGENDDALFKIIGTRGAISGAGLALVETGLIGLIILVYFFYTLHRAIRRSINNSSNLKFLRWCKTLNVIFFVFIYDFFFYSTVLLRTLPMPIIFFTAIATLSYINSRNSLLKSSEHELHSQLRAH